MPLSPSRPFWGKPLDTLRRVGGVLPPFLFLLLLLVSLSFIAAHPPVIPEEKQCSTCVKATRKVAPVWAKNVTLQVIETAAFPVCLHTQGFNECSGLGACMELCHGIVHAYAPEILSILQQDLMHGQRMCSRLNLCPPPLPGPLIPSHIPMRSNLTDRSGEKDWSSWQTNRFNKAIGYFIQVTDLHLDKHYGEGFSSECGLPVCCRAQNGKPLERSHAAGKWGSLKGCDIPIKLMEALYDQIKTWPDQPDFVIQTGDDPAHDIWMQSQEDNLESLRVSAEAMKVAFADVPVFFALGNHEAYPVNQYEGGKGDSWLLEGAADSWRHWLPDDAIKTLRFGGFYAARARPGLRVLALNTNMFIPDNFWLQVKHFDFEGELPWLEDAFAQARAAGEKVLLIGHHSVSQWAQDFGAIYRKVIDKNRDLLVGQLFGHTHVNKVELLHDTRTQSKPIAVAYIGGSLTTMSSGNPAFTLYRYHRETGEILDVEYWWADLEAANAIGRDDRPPVWARQSSARHDYGMKDLSPSSWKKLAESFVEDADRLNAYMNNYYKGLPPKDYYNPAIDGHGVACEALWGDPHDPLCPYHHSSRINATFSGSDAVDHMVQSVIAHTLRAIERDMINTQPHMLDYQHVMEQ